MDKIEFQKARHEDLAFIKKIMLEALQEDPLAFSIDYDEYAYASDEWWEKYMEGYFVPFRGFMLLAIREEKIIGIVGALFRNTKRSKHIATVVWLYVTKPYRRKGLGIQLMKKLLEEIGSNQVIKKLTLYVNKDQFPAQKLYKELGFVESGVHKNELLIDGKFVDTIIMEKLL